jgi:8-oxo-dGTP pyrophosphatase MutT (NUDIX family)
MPQANRERRGTREVSAGGVVYRRTLDGPEFLLIRANGRWAFPKGNIEKGETPERAALREIAEETGLPLAGLRTVRALPSIEYAFQWQGRLVFKTVHNFLVEALDPGPLRPQLSEIEEVRWFSPEAARRTLSFKNSQETLDAAIAAVAAQPIIQ